MNSDCQSCLWIEPSLYDLHRRPLKRLLRVSTVWRRVTGTEGSWVGKVNSNNSTLEICKYEEKINEAIYLWSYGANCVSVSGRVNQKMDHRQNLEFSLQWFRVYEEFQSRGTRMTIRTGNLKNREIARRHHRWGGYHWHKYRGGQTDTTEWINEWVERRWEERRVCRGQWK